MAGNSIGQLFRVTTFGESHGLALGLSLIHISEPTRPY